MAVPLLGAQTGDRPPPQVGLSSLVATAALASLVGWGLLVALPCRLGRARTVWTAAAVAVLLVSFGPLLVPGATTMTTRVTLALMALATAAVLVPGLRRSSPMR